MVNGVSLAKFVLLLVLLITFPSTSFSLEFDFTPITYAHNDKINTAAPGSGAYISPTQGLQLTPDEGDVALSEKVGRATYVEPLHLWDKASGNLIDFTTHFTFVIEPRCDNIYNCGAGLAFFLAPTSSTVGDSGANLGLAHGNPTENNITEPFFAVEFETYPHPMDPFTVDQRLGIDINNMKSVTYARWETNISAGVQNEAWISYSGTSKYLTVIFTHFPPEGTRNGDLSCQVDLREILPEWVMFGFSAATGLSFETSTVKSWDFNATNLQLPVNPPEPRLSPPCDSQRRSRRRRKQNKIRLAIELSIGLSFLGGLATVTYVFWRRSTVSISTVPTIRIDVVIPVISPTPKTPPPTRTPSPRETPSRTCTAPPLPLPHPCSCGCQDAPSGCSAGLTSFSCSNFPIPEPQPHPCSCGSQDAPSGCSGGSTSFSCSYFPTPEPQPHPCICGCQDAPSGCRAGSTSFSCSYF